MEISLEFTCVIRKNTNQGNKQTKTKQQQQEQEKKREFIQPPHDFINQYEENEKMD